MLAITNATIHTITNGVIINGTLLIVDGKIQEIGGPELAVPVKAKVIDARGKNITPGLIEAHSHISIWGEPHVPATADFNEMVSPVQAHLRAIDALNPEDPAIEMVRNAGITTVFTGPGSGNIIGGTGVAIKLKGRTVSEMVIPNTEAMKMALGENPKRNYGARNQKPMTRMGNAAVLREALVAAQNYQAKINEATKNGKSKPERDLGHEALVKVLNGDMKARIHAHRADDIITAIRIAEEFGINYSIEHASEGYLIADILAEKDVSCICGPNLLPPKKHELWKTTPRNAALLHQAGVKVCCMVDRGSETQWLPLHAGVLVRFGLPEEEALRAITINAAEVLGVSDRVGSLEVGKDADLVMWSGHPLHTYTQTEVVIIDGQIVYEKHEE